MLPDSIRIRLIGAFAFLVAVVGGVPSSLGATVTFQSATSGETAEVLGYNLGHFYPGSNTHDWWRYAGVSGARIFISPTRIEPSDDLAPFGDGVNNQDSFVARKTALRADPLNPAYINWPLFENQFANVDLAASGSNHIKPNYALGQLRTLEVEIVAQITASETTLPIASASDWAGKWELWQHYYAQAFYLGRNFRVQRFQMFNEPNHANANGLTATNWLMRLQLAADAIQSALADVNTRFGLALTPLLLAPVSAGSDSVYNGWGSVAVSNRHKNFLGTSDPGYLVFQRYDYHQYNSTPAAFATDLNDLKNLITADLAGETRFPMTISEFNVHTGATFDGMPETLDSPTKYARFGGIVVQLVKNAERELYCFKFGQTSGASGYTYPVAKNGMLYVDNNNAPYNYGGMTKAGEVWRLYNKGFAPGRARKNFQRGAGLESLEIDAAYDAISQRYYLFSVNDSDSPVLLDVECSQWNIPEPNRIIIEEVSEAQSGSIAFYTQVHSGRISERTQPARSVWLYTIPAKLQHEVSPAIPTLVVEASDDATVKDGANKETNYGAQTSVLARNDGTNAANRSAALLKFSLPVIYLPDVELAVLDLQASTVSANSTVQAHVYGLDNDAWSQGTVKWSNAPNLKQGAAAGNTIATNIVTATGASARIAGQIVVNSPTPAQRQMDVTSLLRQSADRELSFLIVQDARWDKTLPSLANGDSQPDGVQIVSREGATANNPGPRLKIVRLRDSDNDGLSDEAETNVFQTPVLDADADDDGLTDGEEVLVHHSNPHVSDSDSDGASDRDETIAGTNPVSAASVLRITNVLHAAGVVSFEWLSVVGKIYDVERTTTLPADVWETLDSFAGTGGIVMFEDKTPPPGTAFYRLRVR